MRGILCRPAANGDRHGSHGLAPASRKHTDLRRSAPWLPPPSRAEPFQTLRVGSPRAARGSGGSPEAARAPPARS
eukprot:6173297-Pleurochrysis_carterae.AAC.4